MSLIKNSIYNLAGFAIPTIIAIPALGLLARLIGAESFGLFTLAFALVGYASIFDAGISRAVIREISLHREDDFEKKQIIATATIVVIALGLCAMTLFLLFSNEIVSALNISAKYQEDTAKSLKLISIIIPIYLINQVWLGYLEGLEKFANINLQRIVTSSVLAILPTLLCMLHASLYSAIMGLVIGRFVSLILTACICRKIIISSKLCFNATTFHRLISFGGWLTISNLISPVMVYFDRFVISHMIGAAKIAFYTAPAEGVSRLINIPYALARALFPKLSYCVDHGERKRLERQCYFIISIVCLPIVIIGALFSSFIMTTWMGPEYGATAANVLKILLIGFYFNALAQIPYSMLQSLGKSKLTASVHLVEVVPYLLLLLFCTNHYGIIGTAFAWSLRTFCDFILLFVLSRR
ncbi:MAG TPA: flippase [Scandinavium sp.]|jgi:O-antigen/teichoic acid export membrane protein